MALENFIKVLTDVCAKERQLDEIFRSTDPNVLNLAKAINDSSIDVQELAEDCLLISNHKFNELRADSCKKNIDVPDRRILISLLIKYWMEIKQENATAGEFQNILQHRYKATLQRWWLYQDECYDCQQIQEMYAEYVGKLTQFIIALANYFSKMSSPAEQWSRFCALLTTAELDSKRKTLLCWVENFGYLEATTEKLKEVLKIMHLQKAIVEIEVNQGGQKVHVPTMCKPFDDFMAYNFDTIIQDLNEEQLQSILHSFECSNAEKIFSKIVLRGNEGVHEYFRKLSEQVQDLSQYDDEFKIFAFNKVPKFTLPSLPIFAELEDYNSVENWCKLHKMLILTSNNMLDLLYYVSRYVDAFLAKEPLTIVQFMDASDETRFRKSFTSLCNMLLDAQLGDLSDLNVIQQRPIDALVSILQSTDFFVFLVLYNCCEKILQNPEWTKFVHAADKMHVLFLTGEKYAKTRNRFECRTLTELSNDKILKILNASEEDNQKNAALAVAKYCGRSLLDLGLVQNYYGSYSPIEISEVLSADSAKEKWIDFRQEYIIENLDPLFHNVAGAITSTSCDSPTEQRTQDERLRNMEERWNKLELDFKSFKQETQELQKETNQNQNEMKANLNRLQEEVRSLKKEKKEAEETIKALEREHKVELAIKDSLLQSKDEIIERLKSELQTCRKQLEAHEQREEQRMSNQAKEFEIMQKNTEEKMEQLQAEIKRFSCIVEDLQKKIEKKERHIARLQSEAPHSNAKDDYTTILKSDSSDNCVSEDDSVPGPKAKFYESY